MRAFIVYAVVLLLGLGLAKCAAKRTISKGSFPVPGYSYRAETKKMLELTQNLADCPTLLGQDLIDEIKGYQANATRIIEAAINGDFKGRTYKELAKFVDKFGTRLSGSQSLEDSIDYMLQKMLEDGYTRTWGEEAVIPHWVRGEETVQLLTPRKKNLAVLGLGTSVGTSAEGLTAEAFVVSSFDDLRANAEKAKGKIVVYNQEFTNYSYSSSYRRTGAAQAAKVGAVAALIRSVADFSLDAPHTGSQNYDVDLDVPHIPAACITIEDAELLSRMQAGGENLTIHLKMLDYNLPWTTSRNGIGELTGTELPDEVVIVSGHIDSWDVGQGAMDDGGGCFISTEAIALIKHLGLTPRRSLQAILWTAEELGLWGAQDYARHHLDDMENIVAAFESDGGTFTPLGLDFAGLSDKAGCIINEILKLTIGTIDTIEYGRYPTVSTDIGHLISKGVPGLSLINADDNYFWYHHTHADTMTMMDSEDLDKGLALWAVASYVIADLSIKLPRTVDPVIPPTP